MSLSKPQPVVADGSPFRIGVVAARFNSAHVDLLVRRCRETLLSRGVLPSRIFEVRVPGSHEVPWAVQRLAVEPACDAVVALGVLLRGATHHHEMVAASVSTALQQVALEQDVPVINGVMAVDTEAQAAERCGPEMDRGAEFADAALEMATLRRQLPPAR